MAVAKKKEAIVFLPQIDIKTVVIKIKGVSPLVTNPFSIKQQEAIKAKELGTAKSKKHEIKNPLECFSQAIYWLSEPPKEYTKEGVSAALDGGHYGFSVGGVKDSAVMAAVRRGLISGKPFGHGLFRITNAKEDKIYGTQCVEIITPNPPKMREDCLSTFKCGPSMRYRPQFDEWRMELLVEFDASVLPLEQLLMWFKLGGFYCGIGENRAEKNAGWGAYELDM